MSKHTKPADAEPGTALATPTRAGALAIPSYLQGAAAGSQLAGVDESDIALPSVRLLQAISEVVQSNNEAEPGTFWHTGFDMPLGSHLDFIICANRKKYLLLAPVGDARKVLARAEDGIHWTPANAEFEVKLKNIKKPVVWTTKPTVAASGLAEYGSYNPEDGDSPPAAVLMYEHLVILPEFPELGPAFFTFARSQIKKVRRELYPKVMLHGQRGRPMQALRFRATATTEQGPEGPYFNVSFSSNGWATEDEFKEACRLQGQFGGLKAKDGDVIDSDIIEGSVAPPAADSEF